MKIAIDAREIVGEKTGKGWYTYRLLERFLALLRQKSVSQLHVILYGKHAEPLFALQTNVVWKHISGRGLLWHRAALTHAVSEKVDLYFSPTSYIVPSLLPPSIQSVLVVHDLIAFRHPRGHDVKATWIEQATLRRALRRARSVVAVSEHTRRDIISHFKFPAEKITVIPPGPAPASAHAPAGRAQSVGIGARAASRGFGAAPARGPYFLAVGTIVPRKNYQTLARAWRNVHEKHPNSRLIIVGKRGWKARSAERELRATSGISLFDYAPPQELNKLYCEAVALVFPSLYEGFGMPVLEALSLGCPVICSKTASLPEVAGDAAIFIEHPENPNELAAAMERLLDDEGLRHRLIEKGYRQAHNFSWDASAQKLYDLFFSYS